MAWYTAQDGQQVWIARDESVYTVIQPTQELAVEHLTYLTSSTKKAVYQEHMVTEELNDRGKVPRRQRERMSGRQRGFILRVDHEESATTRVVPWFKAAANKLVDMEVVSHVDAEEAANLKKKKKNDRTMTTLGVNECRIETTSRIHHFAHGPGFRLEVAEGSVVQKIHFFTCRRQLTTQAWHTHLLKALEECGAHVMLARRVAAEADGSAKEGDSKPDPGGGELKRLTRKDKAQQEDEAWLKSVLDGCITVIDDEADAKESDGSSSGGEEDSAVPSSQAPAVSNQPAQSSTASAPRSKPQQQPQKSSQDWRARGLEDAFQSSLKPSPSESRQPPATGLPRPPARGPAAAAKQEQSVWSNAPAQASNAPSRHRADPGEKTNHNNGTAGAAASKPKPQAWTPQWQPQLRVQNGGSSNQWDDSSWGSSWWEAADGGQTWWQEESWQGAGARSGQGSSGSRPAKKTNQEKQSWYEQRPQHAPPRHSETPAEREAPPKGQVCDECERSIPLYLYKDPEDGGWYCRMCWVTFYNKEPPNR
mmetsp:Transcript_45019/g.106940  ORF Transcript_45019/g.106940 Transcript_45019/m.106940 type:complete len:535 (+) Transcript_45019:92-1696(+)